MRPDLKTFPILQHPETALLASATPSPMTPSDDKIPRMDLDRVNNNSNKNLTAKKSILKNCTDKKKNDSKTQLEDNKLHVKESKLPILTKAVLSPTSTPRHTDKSDTGSNDTKSPGSINEAQIRSPVTKDETRSPVPASRAQTKSPGSTSGGSVQRNLTRTVPLVPDVCDKPNADLVQCRKCGKMKCVQPSHNHTTRTKIKTQINKT